MVLAEQLRIGRAFLRGPKATLVCVGELCAFGISLGEEARVAAVVSEIVGGPSDLPPPREWATISLPYPRHPDNLCQEEVRAWGFGLQIEGSVCTGTVVFPRNWSYHTRVWATPVGVRADWCDYYSSVEVQLDELPWYPSGHHAGFFKGEPLAALVWAGDRIKERKAGPDWDRYSAWEG